MEGAADAKAKASRGRIKYMRHITLEELLEAGCHFGHQVNRRNPKANEFIFEARDGVNIINLENTQKGLIEAGEFVKQLGAKGGKLIIVGTKRQAQGIVKELAEKAKESGTQNLYYVTSRWVGGTLTNFEEVAKNYKKLKDIASFLQAGNPKGYTKRELLEFEREKGKLEGFYYGIKDLEGKPDALFVIDTHLEHTAVAEARAMDVTIVGIVDTNADPSIIDYPIPANDDAVGSVKFITDYILESFVEGQKEGAAAQEAEARAEEAKKNAPLTQPEEKKVTPKAKTEVKLAEATQSETKVTTEDTKKKRTKKV